MPVKTLSSWEEGNKVQPTEEEIKAQIKSHVLEMVQRDYNEKYYEQKIDKILKSGCIDVFAPTAGPYEIPKNILSAIHRELSNQYAPLKGDKKGNKNVNNIYIHI